LRISSILPLTVVHVEADDRNMKPDLLTRSAPHDSSHDHARPWDRFIARLLASPLDHQLATGHPPQSSRALAIRARQIVSPARRRALAKNWSHVLDRAVQPVVPLTPRAPLCRGAVAAAERDVREMIAILAGCLPIAARGAALASWLLTDGAGPLHNHRSRLELSAAVQEAIRQMGSFSDVPPDGADSDSAKCYW
jgi:hypothetical protein